MFSSKRMTGVAVACATLMSLAVPVASPAAVKVNLRVEGATKTLFEKNLEAKPKELRSTIGDNRGAHPCNVASNGGSGARAATPTSALSESGLRLGLNWYSSFNDFLVESVSGEKPEGSRYWSLFVNGKSSELGGCQVGLKNRDAVVWAVTDGSEALLAMNASSNSRSSSVTVTVTDASTGAPVESATVGGRSTNAQGRAVVPRPDRGSRTMKATKSGAIRSNSVKVSARR